MTREEAIKKANDKLGGLTYLSECSANPGLRKVYGNMADWLSKVIYLAEIGLKGQQEQERNEPLTLDELREMDGEPVWVVLGQRASWCIVDAQCEAVFGKCCGCTFQEIGRHGAVYRRKPEEAQE